MLFVPLIGGLISYRRDKNEPIYINQSKVKDPRYFAKSFNKLFFDKWANYDGKSDLFFSKNEKVLLADETEVYAAECDSIVVAQKHDFIPNGDIHFNKEIMVMKSAYIYGDVQIRAIRCLKNMIIGQGITIIRWVDAEGHLFIRDNCNAGLSATSARLLTIGKNVQFKRMYAPVIHIAMSKVTPYNHSDYKYSLVPINDVKRNVETVSDNDLNESNIAAFSIVSKYDVKILERIALQGHIRSSKGIKLFDGAFICGNLFAEEDIYIGKNVIVLGNVFTYGNIYVENEAVIGQEHHTSSIVAGGRIDFGLNIRVYGYVHSEKGGMVFNENLSQYEIKQRVLNEVRTYGMNINERFKHLPHTKTEYNNEHPVGFRNDLNLKEITIPEGVEYIRSSMFYGCKNLVKVILPSSIKVIEDFAFYGCESLKVIEIETPYNMIRIGKSAFEGCKSIETFDLPVFIRTIESSAFTDCTSLKEFNIAPDSFLEKIDSHAFKGCISLKHFNCPSSIEAIGISAFYGCKNLESIHIPPTLRTLGDYALFDCLSLSMSLLNDTTLDLISNTKGKPDWFIPHGENR
jgi:cytoskeletal protein CcmA (bactofilin family)